MTTFSAAVNEDVNGVDTSAEYGDTGDTSNGWFHRTRSADGGHVTIGAKADAAVTNPASSASVVALLKGLITQLQSGTTTLAKLEDAAHASGDAGIMSLAVRNDTRATFGADGDYSPTAVGSAGNPLVSPVPTTLSGWSPTTYRAVAAASGVIKASAGKVFDLVVYNDNAAARYFQLFNLTAVPADGVAAAVAFGIPTKTTLVIPIGDFGHYFSTGICWCLSTTFGTKTIAGADASVLGDYI